MGFWDTVGGLAKSVGNAALEEGKASLKRSQQYKAEMSDKSDDELIIIIKRESKSSPLKSAAASLELKNRGYSQEDIRFQVKN